jgi:hypothetical protein
MGKGVAEMRFSGKFIGLAVGLAMAQPAQACWTGGEVNAAKVANLNMMMMVTALRCRKGSDDFLSDYNAFVKNNNAVIGGQNAAVRSHFARTNGAKGADAAMDKFIIGIANSYGGGHGSMDCAALKDVAQELSGKGHSASSLLAIAESTVMDYPLAGGRCPVNIAAK